MIYFDTYQRLRRSSSLPGRRDHLGVELSDRVRAVFQAVRQAIAFAPAEICAATGEDLTAIVRGIIPGLLGFLAVLVVTTAGGTAAGGALGSLLFGIGIIPGAAVGATVGFNVGIVILNYLGLGFLIAYIGMNFGQACWLAKGAIQEAWSAPNDPGGKDRKISHAARKLTRAIALVFIGILQGVVAYLLAKGTASAAKRVPELSAKLRSSRLGVSFTTWIEKNWPRLIENPRFRPGGGSAPKSTAEERASFNLDRTRIGPKSFSTRGQRQKFAEDWYEVHRMDRAKAESRARGFDFDKDLEIKTLKPGDRIEQWVRVDGKPGIDFTRPGTDPKTLGIEIDSNTGMPVGRVLKKFEVVKEMEVLEGTAATFVQGPVELIGGPGGGSQIAMPPSWEKFVVPIKP